MQKVVQAVQTGLPPSPPISDPLFGGSYRRGFNLTHACSPDLLGTHNSARFEDLHVLDDRSKGHGQGRGQFAHCGRPERESIQHAPPALVSQRTVRPIQVDRLVKHVLEYMEPGPPWSSTSLTFRLPLTCVFRVVAVVA